MISNYEKIFSLSKCLKTYVHENDLQECKKLKNTFREITGHILVKSVFEQEISASKSEKILKKSNIQIYKIQSPADMADQSAKSHTKV